MVIELHGPFSEPVVEISGEDGKHTFAYIILYVPYSHIYLCTMVT